MAFYFQAGFAHSPLRSGVDYMSLAVLQMIGLLAGGGITSVTGHYISLLLSILQTELVRFRLLMVLSVDAGHISCSGFMRHWIGVFHNTQTGTSTAKWATHMVLTGLGLGLRFNVPHIAIQAVMKRRFDVIVLGFVEADT